MVVSLISSALATLQRLWPVRFDCKCLSKRERRNGVRRSGCACALVTLQMICSPCQADVDVALVVAVDVSQTIDTSRYRLQVEGIAAALEDSEVVDRILSGAHGSILLTLVTWSDRLRTPIPWAKIASKKDAQDLARRIRDIPQPPADFTCLTRMMRTVGDKTVTQIPEKADRIVLDVSGDQRENCNPEESTVAVRDDLVQQGITINGLPIIEGEDGPALEGWYRENVSGGIGSFVLPAYGYEDFSRAIKMKFIVEISEAWSGPPRSGAYPGQTSSTAVRQCGGNAACPQHDVIP